MSAPYWLMFIKLNSLLRLVALVGWGVAVSLLTENSSAIAREVPPIIQQSPELQNQMILYVNPRTGDDLNGRGSEAMPLRSITRALQMATPNAVIQLAEGTYTAATGELFPIYLKDGVTVRGNLETRGQGYLIRGSGPFLSRTFARQNVTILGADRGAIAGVTVTNPEPQGYGLWAESTSPTVTDSTFIESTHDGISLVGSSNAQIRNNYFYRNGANGITIYGTSRAEVRENIFEATGFALNINQQAAPLIIANRITQNRDGVVIQASAAPILRNNSIESNERNGVVAIAQSKPDLGTAAEPGGNFIRNNGQLDVNITSSQTVPAFGNEIQKIAGKLEQTQQLAAVPEAPVVSQAKVKQSPLTQARIIPFKPSATSGSEPSEPLSFPVPTGLTDNPTAVVQPMQTVTVPARQAPIAPIRVRQNLTQAAQPLRQKSTRVTLASVPLPATQPAKPAFAPLQRAISKVPEPPVIQATIAPPVMSSIALAPTLVPAKSSQPQAITISVPAPESRSAVAIAAIPPELDLATNSDRSNLLPVPAGNIPLGKTGNASNVNLYQSAQASSPDSPPPLPRLGALINLRYRVVVLTTDEAAQTQIRAVVPDAFRTVVNGRTVWQVGAFGDRAKAAEITQTLAEKGIRAVIEEL